MARGLFNTTVYPIISAKCATCHTSGMPNGNVTGFVDPTPPSADAYKAWTTATGYTAAVGNFTPSSALILQNPLTGHEGTSYTTDEQASVTAWLNAEVAWRGAGAPPPPNQQTPDQETEALLQQWSGCMTQANFDTAKMAVSWGQMQTNNGGACEACHVNGANGMIATEQSPVMFGVISTNKYYMLQFFTVDLTQTPAKVTINTESFLGVSQGKSPHVEHPEFNATTNQGMTALQTFYTSTAASLTAGTCGPSVLTD